MKDKIVFLLFGIGAILITSFLYVIDTDLPYETLSETIIEFSAITVVIFGLFSIVFFIVKLIKRLVGI